MCTLLKVDCSSIVLFPAHSVLLLLGPLKYPAKMKLITIGERIVIDIFTPYGTFKSAACIPELMLASLTVAAFFDGLQRNFLDLDPLVTLLFQ